MALSAFPCARNATISRMASLLGLVRDEFAALAATEAEGNL
jgi:hypothetical protein